LECRLPNEGVLNRRGLHPEFSRLSHEKADEVDHDRADDREESRGGKGRDQERDGGNHRRFQEDTEDAELKGKCRSMSAHLGHLDSDV